jgi:hypothetical protein
VGAISNVGVGVVAVVQGRRRLHTHQVSVSIAGCQREVGEGHWEDVRYSNVVVVRKVSA